MRHSPASISTGFRGGGGGGGGDASINSSQRDGASRERARGGDPAEDSPGSSLDHLIQGQLTTSISRKGGDRLSYHHFFPRSSSGPSIIAFGRGRRKRTATPGRGRPQGLRPPLPLCAQAVVRRGQHQLSPVRSEPLGPARPWGCCCHSCAAAAKRGLGSAQLLIIPAQGSGDVSAHSRTLLLSLPRRGRTAIWEAFKYLSRFSSLACLRSPDPSPGELQLTRRDSYYLTASPHPSPTLCVLDS